LPENPTDAELVNECKRGNIHAYERLYELHASRMKSLAFHLLGSHADAEDTVQETFLKVHKAVPSFEGQSSFATWIYRILINCCYDSLRKQNRRAELSLSRERPSRSDPALKLTLQNALVSLNERQRLVFLMFEVEGLKHSEIAAVLQVPEGTSRSWLFEAKRELKRLLTESAV
jgi:RNA polymerase sigma-70 factor (ECF subfamily)